MRLQETILKMRSDGKAGADMAHSDSKIAELEADTNRARRKLMMIKKGINRYAGSNI